MSDPAVTWARPEPSALLELLKPITWFPPMWAFGCGIVSSGVAFGDIKWSLLIAGILLTGPLVCGASQVVNDWFDRHVDAINEPGRPIPSGRVPGKLGLYFAIAWTALSLLVSTALGFWGLMATIFGLIIAWAYSAPPVRLKNNGWWGNSAVALCYEGLPWFTGALVASGNLPDARIITLALLYSFGAHGIMTLNDFESVEGDLRMGVRSLPAQLGVGPAARLACVVMAAPQVVVAGLFFIWGHAAGGFAILAILAAQIVLMTRLLEQPKERAPWYNATGITLYVSGMLVSAFIIRDLIAGGA